jgi:hypothetical protein
MSIKISDVKIGHAIPCIKRLSGTTISGTFDATGCSQVLVGILRGVNNVDARQVLRIRYSSAATTDYASATAFSTAVIASATTSDSTTTVLGPFLLDMSGKGPHLNFLLSNKLQSANTGVLCVGMQNEKVAPASTGFTAVTGVATAPNNP